MGEGELFARFEEACEKVEAELRSSHSTYVKRHLHPVVLCARCHTANSAGGRLTAAMTKKITGLAPEAQRAAAKQAAHALKLTP